MSGDSAGPEVEWLRRELTRLEGPTITQAVRRALLERPFSLYDEQDYEVRKVEARLAAIAALPARETSETDFVDDDAQELSEV